MLHRISGCSWMFHSEEIPWDFYTWAPTSSTWGIFLGGGMKEAILKFLVECSTHLLPILWLSPKTFLARVLFPVFLIIPLKQGQHFGALCETTDQGNSIVIISFLSHLEMSHVLSEVVKAWSRLCDWGCVHHISCSYIICGTLASNLRTEIQVSPPTLFSLSRQFWNPHISCQILILLWNRKP